MTDTYLIVDDHGSPIGMADMDQITTDGTKLAFALAACCDDPAAMDRVQAQTLARVGTGTFGYVAACAVRILAAEILSPTLDVAAAHGSDLRAGIRRIAAGEEPT